MAHLIALPEVIGGKKGKDVVRDGYFDPSKIKRISQHIGNPASSFIQLDEGGTAAIALPADELAKKIQGEESWTEPMTEKQSRTASDILYNQDPITELRWIKILFKEETDDHILVEVYQGRLGVDGLIGQMYKSLDTYEEWYFKPVSTSFFGPVLEEIAVITRMKAKDLKPLASVSVVTEPKPSYRPPEVGNAG